MLEVRNVTNRDREVTGIKIPASDAAGHGPKIAIDPEEFLADKRGLELADLALIEVFVHDRRIGLSAMQTSPDRAIRRELALGKRPDPAKVRELTGDDPNVSAQLIADLQTRVDDLTGSNTQLRGQVKQLQNINLELKASLDAIEQQFEGEDGHRGPAAAEPGEDLEVLDIDDDSEDEPETASEIGLQKGPNGQGKAKKGAKSGAGRRRGAKRKKSGRPDRVSAPGP
jgi:hypothetical protein